MEANRKRCRVHRLPTEDKTQVLVNTYINPDKHSQSPVLDFESRLKVELESKTKEAIENRGFKYQHLYITTPPIGVLEDGRGYGGLKDGDAVLNIHTGEILTDIKSPKCGQWHLIIATTDPKLFIPTEYKDIEGTLPQPTQALIKAYCEQGGFDEVDVEYVYENSRCVECGEYEGSNICINRKECLKKYYGGELKLKVDSHNTITTHRIEEKMISISDLKPKLIKLLNDNDCFLDLDKWIEENL